MSKIPRTEAILSQLIAEISDRLGQANISSNSADKLAKRGKTDAALAALIDAEPPLHEALDLFRAIMTLRSQLAPAVPERPKKR